MSEYNDAVNRAKRLSVSCDQLLAGKAPPIHVLCEEDILIYLRWLVYQLHCIKNTACFINVSTEYFSRLEAPLWLCLLLDWDRSMHLIKGTGAGVVSSIICGKIHVGVLNFHVVAVGVTAWD